MTKYTKRPRDPSQLAKLVVDIATGETEELPLSAIQLKTAKAGKKGGKARARALSPQERSEIAQVAAQARWKKKTD
ncbi:MAG: hypothetical protein HQ483_16125 [Rhodospirillales bacterium]|nr:hypothetical protein [Rhodospirillales bacterium]